MTNRALYAAAIGVGLAAVLSAQQPTFRVESNLIEVDAVVTDSAGNVVRGLTKDDFTVLDDQKPQAVSTFAFIDLPQPAFAAGGSTAGQAPPPDVASNARAFDGRIYLIVLDDVRIAAEDAPWVVAKAKFFIERYLAPSDRAAIVYFSGADYGTDFTSDKARLVAALEPLIGHTPHPSSVVPQYFAVFRRIARLADWWNEVMPGRPKALLFFTPGQDGASVGSPAGGAASFSAPLDPARGRGRGSGAGGGDATFRQIDANNQIAESVQDTIAAANRANVRVFPIDARGQFAAPSANAEATLNDEPGGIAPADGSTPQATGHDFDLPVLNGHVDLKAMAADTGAEPVLDTSNFGGGFARIVRDTGSYYALAYLAPTGRKPGSLHSISVLVRKPGVVVRARRGYAVPTAPPNPTAFRETLKPARVSSDVVAALNDPIPFDGVGVSAFAAPFKGVGANASVLVGVEVSHLSMTRAGADGRFANDVELSVAVTDVRSLKEGRQDRLHVTLPANAEATSEGGVRVLHRIAIAPGQYQLRIAARDGTTGKVGSVVRDLDVPDFTAPVAMSGVALASNRSRDRPTTGDAEPLSALLEAPPAARRDFSPADVIDVFAEVYEATISPATVVTSIRSSRGDVVFTETENVPADTFRSDRRAYAHHVRFRVEDLDGQYVLRIEAKTGDGASVMREIPFSVTR